MKRRLSGALTLFVLAACSHAPSADAPIVPADAFFARLSALCGRAFAGRIVEDVPAPGADDPFAGKSLVMHVRECGATDIRIPFHVGDDRSRTWVIARTADGLRLKHDHRHADGTPDALTMYGGDGTASGTAVVQRFPADAESIALFRREGRAVSVANVWSVRFDEAAGTFEYALHRPGRAFRVAFDLRTPIPAPPPPWGASP